MIFDLIVGSGQTTSDPSALFASGEQGAWYDPSDISTMFQDRAGTTPVTADGQTVGKILDKSGRGNHAVAPTDASRPIYKTNVEVTVEPLLPLATIQMALIDYIVKNYPPEGVLK